MPGLGSGGSGGTPGDSPFSCTSQQFAAITALVGGDAAIGSTICSTVDVTALGYTNAVLQWTVGALKAEQQTTTELANGLNTAFVLASAYQVFIMQAGFALYAAGVVRAKNVSMILMKNFMDACVASITFYLVGYAFAFGNNGNGNGFIGNSDFALSTTSSEFPSNYAFWFWNWAFAAASCTILSGSIAERATFHAYLIYSFFMTLWVYPLVAHWIWAPDGWLSAHNSNSILGSGCIDFSGSGVVHMVGGFASIMGSIATGPRTGRFDSSLPVTAFKGSSPSLYTLGTFLLWFGWYGFNPGSHLAINTYTNTSGVSRTAVTTTLSAGAGALSALFLIFKRTHTWDLLGVCTGALSGLVAVTAGCGVITPWAAIICGIVAAPIYVYGEAWMEYMQIDDPVGAFPVHGLCGLWGVFFVGLLANEQYINEVYGKPMGQHLMGIFYGGHGQLLLCQIIAILVIAAWSSFWIGLLFFTLRHFNLLRVPLEQEAQGMDGQLNGSHQGINPRSITKFNGSSSEYTVGVGNTGSSKGSYGATSMRMNGNHMVPLVTITENAGPTNGHGTALDIDGPKVA